MTYVDSIILSITTFGLGFSFGLYVIAAYIKRCEKEFTKAFSKPNND